MTNQPQYMYQGFIKVKSHIVLNLVMFFLFSTTVYFAFPTRAETIIWVLFATHLVIAIATMIRSRKTKVVITENHCEIEDYRLFGIIKEYRNFEILKEEQYNLIKMFKHLSSNKNKIQFFTIDAIDDTFNQKIIFKNLNLSHFHK